MPARFLNFQRTAAHHEKSSLPCLDLLSYLLSEIGIAKTAICVGVKDTSPEFLQYLDKHQISLGSEIEIINKEAFDMSLTILMNGKEILISNKIAGNLFVKVM